MSTEPPTELSGEDHIYLLSRSSLDDYLSFMAAYPVNAQELDRQLLMVSDEISKLNPDRSAVASAASAAAPLAQRIAERLTTMQYDQAVALRMLQRIPDEAENIALADERAAEQAVMALDSLYIAYSKDAKPANAAEVRAAINALFQQLENPSVYNADQFASALRRIRTLLP